MTNELITIVKILLSFTFIRLIFSLNKHFLYISIVLNLLLVSIFGAKLISLFGFITNNGNIFYASVFFATQLIAEQYGRKEAYKSIWIGAASIIFFMLIAQLTILQLGDPSTQRVNSAINILFQAAPRIAVASVIAYVVAQFVNISLFSYIKSKTSGKLLFLRVNLANIVGQLVDSLIFFSVAFYGTGPLSSFIQILIVGYVMKVVVGFLSTPFFYLGVGNNGSGKEK